MLLRVEPHNYLLFNIVGSTAIRIGFGWTGQLQIGYLRPNEKPTEVPIG